MSGTADLGSTGSVELKPTGAGRLGVGDGRGQLVVTIDGPAGTGKSTVAGEVARRIGFELLDTGAMYRAATALAIDHGLDLGEGGAIAELVERASLRFAWGADPPMLTAFAADVTHRLRDDDVTRAVSTVAGHAEVRAVLVEAQRAIAGRHPRLVSEGRDQGSVVFPDAAVKFYLDATARVRAERRVRQLREGGRTADVDAIETEIAERDRLDRSRAVAPLTCPAGAVRIDTTELAQGEVVAALERVVRERLGDAVESPGVC